VLIVPGRPTSDGLIFWLYGDAQPPVLELRFGNSTGPRAANSQLTIHQMGQAAIERDVYLVAATGLDPDTDYALVAGVDASQICVSRTLPRETGVGEHFTIALGSCYSPTDRFINFFYDDCCAAISNKGLGPVRMRFLVGDQVYMDLAPGSGSPLYLHAPDPMQRYVGQWTNALFGNFITKTPTLVMADDHEFWNDYPHGAVWLRWTPDANLGQQMDRAYEVFQAGLNIDAATLAAQTNAGTVDQFLKSGARTFRIRDLPLDVFFMDTRTRRTRYDEANPQMCGATDWIQQAVQFLRVPGKPKVLVVSQPIIETAAGGLSRFFHTMGDINLPDYHADFRRLWEALINSPNDVMVLSGDIHWSRLCKAAREAQPNRVFEVISSPLALIPIGGKADMGHHDGEQEIDDIPAVPWNVMAADPSLSPNPACRTNESATISTLTFTPKADGSVGVTVYAWLRNSNGTLGIAYARSFDMT
jgi:hypothetical protein